MPRKSKSIRANHRRKTKQEPDLPNIPRVSARPEKEVYHGEFIPDLWKREAATAQSKIFWTIGDLGEYPANEKTQLSSMQAVEKVIQAETERAKMLAAAIPPAVKLYNERAAKRENTVEGAALAQRDIQTADALRVDPPPADYMAMMRASDYYLRTCGDIFQTISIPIQLLLKDIDVSADDTKAQTTWQDIFTDKIPLMELAEAFWYCSQMYGQSYPLEAWSDDNHDIEGIVMLEPLSMWVGHHLSFTSAPMAVITPENFTSLMFKNLTHNAAFNSFSVDLNIQTIPAMRVPIREGYLRPIYAYGKLPFHRYAVPPIARAFRNLMFRDVLYEYRLGITEGYIAQLWMFIVGTPDWEATPKKMRAIREMILSAAKNRNGALIVDHAVKGEVLTPKELGALLASDTLNDVTAAIFRDLGFSTFFADGAVPGAHGRGGGVQVDIDVQVGIERWDALLRNTVNWFKYIARKFAKQSGDEALLKYPAHFTPGAVGIKTQKAIADRIVPLLTTGTLDQITALKDSGYSYETVKANKARIQKDGVDFSPPATFKQQAVGMDGSTKTVAQSNTDKQGRPRTQSDEFSDTQAYEVRGQRQPQEPSDFEKKILLAFMAMLNAGGDRDAINGFASDLETDLREQMTLAFQDGYMQYGGFGEPDYSLLNNDIQGMPWHIAKLRAFKSDLLNAQGSREDLLKMRTRAADYASAVHTAYVLGTQDAMKKHGAKFWQRILHPELSIAGPCSECTADSAIVHPISEVFTSFHPGEVCAAQSVIYHFGDRLPTTVPIPDNLPKDHLIRRMPLAG